MNPDQQYELFTRRNLLIFFAALTLSMGWTLRVPALLFLGEFLAAIIFCAWIYSRRLLETFEARRGHQKHLFEGAVLHVKLVCRHRSFFPLHLPELVEEFSPGERYYIRNVLDRRLPRGEQLTLNYSGRCTRKRGLYLLGPLRVNAGDPLGLFYRERLLETLTPLYLLPNSQSVAALRLLSAGTVRHAGEETLPRLGQSEAFINMRGYRRGDHPRLIHWPTSARRGELIVRELEDHVMTDVNVFLDLRRIANRGLGELTSAELMIKAAACVAQTALERRHRLQLFALTAKPLHVPLGDGPAHLYHVLEQLTLAQARGNADFGEFARNGAALIRPGATAVWIVAVSAFEPEWIEPLLPGLYQDEVRPLLILIDDRTFLKLYQEQDRLRPAAADLQSLVARMKARGCIVHTLGRDDNIVARLTFAL